jgi:hypothetical protein
MAVVVVNWRMSTVSRVTKEGKKANLLGLEMHRLEPLLLLPFLEVSWSELGSNPRALVVVGGGRW